MSESQKSKPEPASAVAPSQPENALWPRPVIVDRFGPRPFEMKLAAEPQERVAIAKAFGCVAIDELGAKLTLTRKGARLNVEGQLLARVTQSCIVTLEPVNAVIRESITITFAPPAPVRGGKGRAETETEETIQMDVADPPELILDGTADLGAAMLEFFALALEPYPRKAGAEFVAKQLADPAEHPFAALAKLKPGK